MNTINNIQNFDKRLHLLLFSNVFLLLITLLLAGVILHQSNELHHVQSECGRMRTLIDNLYLEVENLKRVGIPVTHETPPSKIPWASIGGLVGGCICIIFLFLGDGPISPSQMLNLINNLGDQLVKATLSGVINLNANMEIHGNNNIALTDTLHYRINALEAILCRIEYYITYNTPGSRSVADGFLALPAPVFPISDILALPAPVLPI